MPQPTPLPRLLCGSTLKRIAAIAMLVDHLAYFLLLPALEAGLLSQGAGRPLYLAARIVGRLSFPLFCLLIAEGFFFTKSPRRYLMRLLCLAVVSEIPFDLAGTGRAFDWQFQNVFFTLALGLMLLMLLQRITHPLATSAALLGACALALLIRCDYDALGVLLIAVLGLLREQPRLRLAAAAPILFFSSLSFFGTAALSLIPIGLYDDSPKKEPHPRFFYWLYPAHLLGLYLLRTLLSL